MPRMLTLKEASAETGLTYNCLRRWILDGQFPYFVKSGNRFLINMERLAEFLDSPSTLAAATEKAR